MASLSGKRVLLLLALLSSFPPLSTDMYLAALPLLQRQWGQSQAAINSTLVLWFVTYCFSLLVYGPISDRVGRRPPLFWGLTGFIVASLACALANGLAMLLVARVAQAAGAAASTVMVLAIAKDLFGPRERSRVLAYAAVIHALAPMLAPTLGGWIITSLGWRYVFVLLVLPAALALRLVARLPETLATPSPAGAGQAFRGYLRLLANGRFSGLNAAMAMPGVALFAFIAASSDLYITRLGLSEVQFGYLFGFNALALMAGAFGFSRLGRLWRHDRLMLASFQVMALAGCVLALLPHQNPWCLALPMWLISFCGGLSRPASNNLVLEQARGDAGSASSLIAFANMMAGALAMALVSLGWQDPAVVIGILALLGGTLALVVLLGMRGTLASLNETAPRQADAEGKAG